MCKKLTESELKKIQETKESDDILVCDRDNELIQDYAECFFGHRKITLTSDLIKSLQNGKELVLNDGEYSTSIVLEE